jgi:predicted O-methyltransferase YrrM
MTQHTPLRPDTHSELHDLWTAMDDLLDGFLIPDDVTLNQTLQATDDAGMKAQNVAPNQGKFLHLLARIHGAKRILEIGTLGGYSTIWLARALPDDGQAVSLELNPKHADVARANLAQAGVAEKVTVRVGTAVDSLTQLADEGAQFDFVFIDADKPNNLNYFNGALKLVQKGAVIIVDNVVRKGEVLDANSDDENVQGVHEVLQAMRDEPRVDVMALQTVGRKGYDGLAMALVVS